MNKNVKVLKLITGEEIITQMTEDLSGKTLTLESPMVVREMQPDATGKTSVGLTSWSFAGKTDRVTLETKHVLVKFEPTSAMDKNYAAAVDYEKSVT